MAKDNSPLPYAPYKSNLTTVANNLAQSLSTFVPTPAENSGDNINATTIAGYTLINETFIEIQWPWLILPLGETSNANPALRIHSPQSPATPTQELYYRPLESGPIWVGAGRSGGIETGDMGTDGTHVRSHDGAVGTGSHELASVPAEQYNLKRDLI